MTTRKSNAITIYGRILILQVAFAVMLITSFSAAHLWLRQQITYSARQIETLEDEIARLQRDEDAVSTRIAEIHHPEYLKATVAIAGLSIGPVTTSQVVVMTEENRKRSEPLERENPFYVAIDLPHFSEQNNAFQN